VKLHIPVAHVEAGLRSFNRRMPEEINRILTDHAADLLFTPTDTASNNLMNEGVAGNQVIQVGDVMYDAALYYGERAKSYSKILSDLKLKLKPKSYILATIHRAENTDDAARMKNILDGFANSSRTIVMPLHPRTAQRIEDFGLELPSSIINIDPVGYLDMVMLEMNAQLIVTDSGGVQKEAYFHQVPCVTIREETEWVELVKAGTNRLVGANAESIASELNRVTDNLTFDEGLYGAGDSAEKIARLLSDAGKGISNNFK
jgi:UDP-GlcNAc3NAcA epimerase